MLSAESFCFHRVLKEVRELLEPLVRPGTKEVLVLLDRQVLQFKWFEGIECF